MNTDLALSPIHLSSTIHVPDHYHSILMAFADEVPALLSCGNDYTRLGSHEVRHIQRDSAI